MTPPLSELFPIPTPADWRALAEAELKGARFEKRLVTRTPEGIDLQPLYAAPDCEGLGLVGSLPGFAPFARGTQPEGNTTEGWEICQELVLGNPREFNAAARTGLDRGLTAINFYLDKATRDGLDPDMAPVGDVGLGGVSIATTADLARALDGVDIEKVPLFVRTGSSALPFAALLIAWVRERGCDPARLRGCIEMDPLGVLSHEGSLPHSLEGAYREMAHLTTWASTHAPELQTICVHSRAFHESGGSAVQELAAALAAGAEYLREMSARDLHPDRVAPRIRFSLSSGTRLFMEIAKFRAARALWSRIVAAFGGSAEAQRMNLHVRTSRYSMTVCDPYVNLLRATTEAFAGVVGGCDSLHVAPFDEAFRSPDEFSRRIARNTQILLKEECHFHRVIDPAGGSYFVESLTDQLAARAWAQFQRIEAGGGLGAALVAGTLQKEIAATAAARAKDLAHRRESLIGTNVYANPTEKPLDPRGPDLAALHRTQAQRIQSHRISLQNEQNTLILHRLAEILDSAPHNLLEAAIDAARAGATLGEITRTLRSGDVVPPRIEPLRIHRAAEPFEDLRAAADVFRAKTGAAPRIRLLCMGPIRQHKVRADFCTGFLEVAGFTVDPGTPCATPEEAIEAATGCGAPVCVICSTDETYPELVPAITAGIKSRAPSVAVIVAGLPSDHVDAFRTSGVDDFIHVRADALALLTQLQRQAGVRS